MEQKHKGAASELIAVVWLLKQGYEVYRNVSAFGVSDLLATKDGELLKIDVKTGMKRNGRLVTANPSKAALDHGVKLLIVDLEKGEVFGFSEERTVTCMVCNKSDVVHLTIGWKKFCSKECREKRNKEYGENWKKAKSNRSSEFQ